MALQDIVGSLGSNCSGTLAPKISVVSLYINLVNVALAANPNKALKYYDPGRIFTRLITHELQLLWGCGYFVERLRYLYLLWGPYGFSQLVGFAKEGQKSGSSLLRLSEQF